MHVPERIFALSTRKKGKERKRGKRKEEREKREEGEKGKRDSYISKTMQYTYRIYIYQLLALSLLRFLSLIRC